MSKVIEGIFAVILLTGAIAACQAETDGQIPLSEHDRINACDNIRLNLQQPSQKVGFVEGQLGAAANQRCFGDWDQSNDLVVTCDNIVNAVNDAGNSLYVDELWKFSEKLQLGCDLRSMQ